MIELSKTQKSVLKVLKDTYKKDTVTRAEINALVKKHFKHWPSLLSASRLKIIQDMQESVVEEDINSDSTQIIPKKSFCSKIP